MHQGGTGKKAAAHRYILYGSQFGSGTLVATATQRRGWNIDSVVEKDETERDNTRSVRARQRALGREIRRMFDGVVKEPVPDDFIDLLKRIDESDEGKGGEPRS